MCVCVHISLSLSPSFPVAVSIVLHVCFQSLSALKRTPIARKLENYKSKDDLQAAVEVVDAMIIRSDIVDAAVLEKAAQLKIVVRAGAGAWMERWKDENWSNPPKESSRIRWKRFKS